MNTAQTTPLRTSRDALLVVRAYNHAVRFNIINLLDLNGEMAVHEIYSHPGMRMNSRQMEQSVCSAHLAILRGARLVSARKKGKLVYYSLERTNVQALERAMAILSDLKRNRPPTVAA